MKNTDIASDNKISMQLAKSIDNLTESNIDIQREVRETEYTEKEISDARLCYISMASHELKTPLSGILTSLVLLKKYYEDGNSTGVYKHISSIKKSVKYLNNLNDECVILNKLDHGLIKSSNTKFTFSEIITEIYDYCYKCLGKKITIIDNYPYKNIMLFQDRELIKCIFVNILSNSIKYSTIESVIELGVDIQGGNIIVTILDHGIGIPEEDQKFIFNRFFRSRNVSTISGVGLGLSIVNEYLKLINGSIRYESIENKGTTFKLTIPMGKI